MEQSINIIIEMKERIEDEDFRACAMAYLDYAQPKLTPKEYNMLLRLINILS